MPRRKKEEIDNCWDEARPPQRNAANARERSRMRVLSKAFCRLKTTLPWVPSDTKLSKLDTLRLATTYIAHLRQTLLEDEEGSCSSQTVSSCNSTPLSWPFAFNKAAIGSPEQELTNSPDVSSTQKWYYKQDSYIETRNYPESYDDEYFPFDS